MKQRNFKSLERYKQLALMTQSDVFESDPGNGRFGSRCWPFVLKHGERNLYRPIREDVQEYFRANGISWWKGLGPSGHVLSSQIACLNHLFAIRHDRNAVLDLLNGVRDEFVDVLPVPCDAARQGYIAFEVVSAEDHLNEKQTTRGSNCTSVDAFIYAKHRNNDLWLIPIEWKYTEAYADEDKSGEIRGEDGAKGVVGKGVKRMRRYNDLIAASAQLRTLDEYGGSVYYQEPFYQLMRQTLWAEQVIRHRDTEMLKADEFMHIHVIPSRNHNLLQRIYKVTGQNMEDSWRGMLTDQSRYVIVDPESLMSVVEDRYPDLCHYLRLRYW